ncbi:Acetyltransferase involved in cellulose biosynthesis, CelD/BcsL family [Marinobacter daqiaonensis]|uniref:Acetyltransferase involved in cellulose biosynthesis, CelD/BcsL family n=1 Tax=Marinobacter daqiaonensis TaxID=650891 RepID=A0A1I6HWP5_9GAMM|nr:GNAT family N-acetyltransferase [Marinobacter daqiaonensis]SFR58881.1 Acetyltransferase involved in cellulose biosynthesis, CelD/BcsL family [Marinobacter daqiaonensis]
MTAGKLQVTQYAITDPESLREEWEDLESRSTPTVFLSWQWLGHWLAVYRPNVRVLRVTESDRLVGLGMLVASDERRHGVLRSRCLRLHQTGSKALDQIWIEYNGFLAEHGRDREVAAACLSFLKRQENSWDEFVIGAIDADEADFYATSMGLHKHVRWEAPCYGVDLNQLRAGGQHYLDTLSRNTRYQINRAHRLYENRGEVELVRPDTVTEALAVFDSIGPRHLERWGSGPDESGFANPDFVRFHRSLIKAQWPLGGVDLVSVRAGDDVIASFYNLLHNQVVYFYLGGMRTETDNKLKPGLLGHSLCIEDYRHHGFHYYDFMGGDERYKSNLGRFHRQLVQVALQRPRFKLRLENALREAKQQWLREPGANYGR